MQIIASAKEIQNIAITLRGENKKIGFVPTMGALHPGHLSLIEKANQENDLVFVSIFVNPMQFNNPDDLVHYPRNLDADSKICKNAGADYIFAPTPHEIYPDGFTSQVEVCKLEDLLCGAFRPGHFLGVTTVVAKLFNIVQPHKAYFGEKDWQQCAIINKMVDDLAIPVEIITCPTIRESDGLAMSSRNQRLNPAQRQLARQIPELMVKTMEYIRKYPFDLAALQQQMQEDISKLKNISIEYFYLINEKTLEQAKNTNEKLRLVIAAQLGEVRLIDNMPVILDFS